MLQVSEDLAQTTPMYFSYLNSFDVVAFGSLRDSSWLGFVFLHFGKGPMTAGLVLIIDLLFNIYSLGMVA